MARPSGKGPGREAVSRHGRRQDLRSRDRRSARASRHGPRPGRGLSRGGGHRRRSARSWARHWRLSTRRAPAGRPHSPLAAASAAAGPGQLTAPIPGVIASIAAMAGQMVQRGDDLLTIEAMKMFNVIRSPWAGTVAGRARDGRQACHAGQVLRDLDALVVIHCAQRPSRRPCLKPLLRAPC